MPVAGPNLMPGMGFMRRRPAVGAAAAVALGIWLHPFFPVWPLSGAGVALVVLALAWRMLARPYACSGFVAIALTLVGVLLGQMEHYRFRAGDVAAYATDTPRLAQVELFLDRPPRVISLSVGRGRPLPPRQVTTARVTRVLTWDGWRDASGDVLVQIDQPHPRLAQGQTVRVVGLLQRPSPAVNPGQFDWAKYYREQRILASISVPHADNLTIVSDAGLGALGTLRATARQLLATGFEATQSLDHAILRALLLGDSDPEMRDVQDQFRRTGTSHHLAISGMHVAVLGGVVYGACRLMRLRPRLAVTIMLGFVVVYGLAALPSPPVVRSILLAVCYALAVLGRRGVDFIQLLALSVLMMLVYHPLDLYNAGFQLSFGTVLGLMMFTSPVSRWLVRGRDPAPPDEPVLMKLGRRADHLMLETVLASVVAWVVSMPLIAFHFEQLNVWAVVAGIVLAPVVFVALVGGMMKVVLTLLWPGGATEWAWAAQQPVRAMRGTVDWLATFPLADVPFPSPPVWLVLLFFATLLANLRPPHLAGLRVATRVAPVVVLVALFLSPFQTRALRIAPQTGSLRVTLLAVGAGQCAVVEPPSGRTVLIDAGSLSLSDPVRKCIAPFLRSRGQTGLDTIFISHANVDHFNAVADLSSAYDVREVLVGPQFREQCAGNAPAEAMLKALDAIDRPPRVVQAGDILPLGRDTSLQILWPTPESTAPANDVSLVVRLTHAGRSILFTGDIQASAEKQMSAEPGLLECDVLVAPHHGSSEATTAEFLKAASPRAIVSSNDRTLSRKQRDFDALVGGTPLLRTNRTGAITIDISAAGDIHIQPFLTGADKPPAINLPNKQKTVKP